MNHNGNTGNTENVIPKLRTPGVSLFIGIVYFVLILMTLIVLYNRGIKTKSPHGASRENKTATLFIAIFFIILILGLLIALLPNLSDLKILLSQMVPVVYVVLYTIFLICFLRYLPSDTLNKYPYIITAVTMIFSGILFYKGFTHDYISEFNLTYEKIKLMILFFCLITTFIIYYSVNPGDIITKTFGPTFLLTILLSVFAFLYLVAVFTFTLPGHGKGHGQRGGSFSDIESISVMTLYSNILFFIFLFLLFIGVYNYPDGLLSNAGVSAFVIIFSLLICLIYAGIQIVNVYTNINPSSKILYMSNISLFRESLLMLFGIIVLGIAISWIGINMQKLSDNPTGSTVMTVLLNLFLFLMVITLIYKIMHNDTSPGKSEKGSPLSEFIKSILFFIPCVISNMIKLLVPLFKTILNLILYIPCLFLNTKTSANKASDDSVSIFIICSIIVLILLNYLVIYLKRRSALQGGKLYLNDPINTNTHKTISTYEELNGNENFNYHYGISCWLFLDSFSPNTNASYRYYTSLLNYGNKPNVLYNAELNTMIITVPKPGLQVVKNVVKEIQSLGENQKNIDFTDKKGININVNEIDIDLNSTSMTNDDNGTEKMRKEIKKGKNNINLNKIHIDLTTSNDLEEFDSENVIVYRMEKVLLQKWNNLIINYDGGTLDIFYNNDLVKSISGIVPYMSYDSLSVGQNDGINGGICNLIYFKKTLTATNTYYLYNSVKNQKTPVIDFPSY